MAPNIMAPNASIVYKQTQLEVLIQRTAYTAVELSVFLVRFMLYIS